MRTCTMLITCQRERRLRLRNCSPSLFLHVNNGTMAESSGKELAREAKHHKKKERKVSFGSAHRFTYETADRSRLSYLVAISYYIHDIVYYKVCVR